MATKRTRSKVARQKLALRDSIWPDLEEDSLWDRAKSNGWLSVPRAMPLVLQIMDSLSKGKPLSATYFDLWCRAYDDSFVIANKDREMAFSSGFTGERAVRTWASRMKILADLGFISVKSGPSGPLSYVLLMNPYNVLSSCSPRPHHQQRCQRLTSAPPHDQAQSRNTSQGASFPWRTPDRQSPFRQSRYRDRQDR